MHAYIKGSGNCQIQLVKGDLCIWVDDGSINTTVITSVGIAYTVVKQYITLIQQMQNVVLVTPTYTK